METVKTSIYDSFQCIADKCDFTCCQEWKIAVDDETNEKWKNIKPPVDTEEMKDNLCAYTEEKDELRVISLNEKGVCPFLNKDRLCKLVMEHGDLILSKTCATFPREIHEFASRTEYTLMPSCPAVLDLIKEEGVAFFSASDNIEKMVSSDEVYEEELYFAIRDFFMELMKDEERTVEQSLLMIFYVALELLEMDDEEELTLDAFLAYKNSDIFEELFETIDNMDFNAIYTFEERNELLLDLSENYRKEGLYKDLLEPICQRAEMYSKERESGKMDEEILFKKCRSFGKRIKKSEEFFRDFLIEEIFADCFTPESTYECMVVKLQWLAMEYGAMMQAIFLYEELMEESKEKASGLPKAYPFDDLKKMIVLIFRMTGYEDEDIYEYLENSFEDLIWEWGYFALVVGE